MAQEKELEVTVTLNKKQNGTHIVNLNFEDGDEHWWVTFRNNKIVSVRTRKYSDKKNNVIEYDRKTSFFPSEFTPVLLKLVNNLYYQK
jgi:hypothetical protein